MKAYILITLIFSLCYNYVSAGEVHSHPYVNEEPQANSKTKGGLSLALNEAFFDKSKNFFLYYLFQQLERHKL